MINLDVTHANPQLVKNRWADSKRVSKGVDMEAVMKEAAQPVRVMLKWLLAMWMVQQVSFNIELEIESGLLPGTAPGMEADEPPKGLSAERRSVAGPSERRKNAQNVDKIQCDFRNESFPRCKRGVK